MNQTNHTEISTNNLQNLSDEKLIEVYRDGLPKAVEVLVQRYKYFVRSKVRTNFFVGADREDLIQEGMIGLFKAINDYDITRKASFCSFASLCIKGQISTALKTATRQKHMVLNTSLSLDKPVFDDGENNTTFLDILKLEPCQGPEEQLIKQEKMILIEQILASTLSPLENSVLELYLEGKSYEEISKQLNRPSKSVDNALQRIKKKLEGVYDENIAT